jgi:signal transduction histidine kinase
MYPDGGAGPRDEGPDRRSGARSATRQWVPSGAVDVGEVVEALEWVLLVVYGLLAMATAARSIQRRDAATAWAAAVFAVLTGVLVASLLFPVDRSGRDGVGSHLLLAVFVLIPYLLFRFAATMRRPGRRLRAAAAGTVVVVSLAAFAFDAPEGDDTSVAFSIYTVLVLAYWIGLSAMVAGWLWRGGAGRATVVRRRMRTLAVAVGILAAAALLLGAGGSEDAGALELVSVVLVLVAGPLFLVGVAPPRGLLARWRRADEAALHRAEAGLVAATSPNEVADALLPYVARAMGGDVALLTDPAGSVLATHGIDASEGERLVASGSGGRHDVHVTSIDMASGQLHLVSDPYTPYFSREDRDALERLAALTDVALRRARVTEAEQRSAAELQRANEAMREFVSIASHDLRTPIAVIKGFAQTMTFAWETTADEQKLMYLETIARQADHLARIVADLLTTSKLDAGALEPRLEELDLRRLVDETLTDLGHEADVAIDEGTTVLADHDHATRIVRNLVENATSYGEPPIVLSAHPQAAHVELHVRDHGPGVPDAFVPRLFERFARAEASASKAKQGTGLGLAIVQGLARVTGGDVWYEAADPGARFVVRFERAGQSERVTGIEPAL